ncbi:MAG: hypothetical protein M3417_03560 [Actinomycetota bacterium]|nr:hypothetical protein [Actinomycetota bacterium]
MEALADAQAAPADLLRSPARRDLALRLTALESWGKRRPEARGKLTACPNKAGCEKLGRATLRLRRLRAARCEGTRGRYYVRGTIFLDGRKTPLVLSPSYVCG